MMPASDVGGGGACPTPLYWSFVLHLFQYPPTKQEKIENLKSDIWNRYILRQYSDQSRKKSNISQFWLRTLMLNCPQQAVEREVGEMEVEIQPSSTAGMVVSLIYSNLFIPVKKPLLKSCVFWGQIKIGLNNLSF